MKRLLKATLLVMRSMALHIRYTKLYYWTEKRLFELKSINPMPDRVYCFIYRMCMTLLEEKRFIGLANWLMHRIPFNVRCHLA